MEIKLTLKLEVILLVSIAMLQWFLFSSFVEREVAWSPFLNGDANDYLSQSYIFFDALLKHDGMLKHDGVPREFILAPHGISLLLLSSGLYLLFGANRLMALAPNLLLFLIFQIVTYLSVKKITGSSAMGLISVALLLCLQLPFQLNPNLLLNIMEYQREFLVFSLLGIYIWAIIISNTFENLRVSVFAGLIGGILITFRYVTVFHVASILAVFGFVLAAYSFRNGKRSISADYIQRLKNLAISGLLTIVICFYPLYLARAAMFGHYMTGKITGARDQAFIDLYQQGVTNFTQQVIYYPNVIVNVFTGRKFFITTGIVIISLFLLWIFERYYYRHRLKQDQSRAVAAFSYKHAYIFCTISIIVPLVLLTFYPTRSAQMGTVIVPPLVILLLISLSALYNAGNHGAAIASRWLAYLKCSLLFVVMAIAVGFQINAYSMVGLSTVTKRDYKEVSRLYDDIIKISHQMQLTSPTVAADFIENYSLGCARAIVAYQYEHEREILKPKCIFPTDVGAVYDEKTARQLISKADIVILSLEETPLDAFIPEHRDPLTHVLDNYPFPRSIAGFRKDLHQDIYHQYKHVGTYKIFNRVVRLFESGRRLPAFIAVSSSGDSKNPARVLFDDSKNIWHSASPPEYPQIIQFRYDEPRMMTSLSLSPQIGGSDRAPSSFVLEGQESDGSWTQLLLIKGFKYAGDDSQSWQVKKYGSYTSFRLIIYANGGSPAFVTIRKLIPLFLDNKSLTGRRDR